jgi:hypothetical protein
VIKRYRAVLGIILIFGFAARSDLLSQPKDRLDKWEYMVLRHSPHLREGGSDIKRLQSLGKEGWEVASSYGGLDPEATSLSNLKCTSTIERTDNLEGSQPDEST